MSSNSAKCSLNISNLEFPNAAAFARDRRVLLLRSSKGVGLDVSLAALPYEALVIHRSSYFVYPQMSVCEPVRAEDLIVLKALRGTWTGLGRCRTNHRAPNREARLGLHS